MKCEDFLKQWQNDDHMSGRMKEHLSVCESCRAKVKDYADILLYIKEDKYPHTVNVADTVMQKIEEQPMPITNMLKRYSIKHIVTVSLSMAATVALILTVGWKVGRYNRVQLQNEDITSMFIDVYGYDQTEQYASFNQLDAIEYFLENYEI